MAICDVAHGGQESDSPDAALWRAIAEDHAEGVIAALKAGAYVDSKEVPRDVLQLWRRFSEELEGAPPLFAAIYLKKTDLALLLLAHGANPKSRCPRGSTPVQVAIMMGDEKVFSALVDKGADIRSEPDIAADPDHRLRLVQLAAFGGSLKIMSAVRAAGHDLPADPRELKLLEASIQGTPRMLEYLVRETGITLSPEITSDLVKRARFPGAEIFLRYFLEKGYLAESSLAQLLVQALEEKMDGLADDILTTRPDLWSTDMTEAIARRIRRGNPGPMVDLFFRFGRESILLPHLNDMFLYCGLYDDLELTRSLLERFQVEKGEKPKYLGFALLGSAKGLFKKDDPFLGPSSDTVKRSFESLAEEILQEPEVAVDLPDEQGRTPLWYAIQNESLELAKHLLAKGAKVAFEQDEDYDGASGFLHLACQQGMHEIVADLVAAGADIEAKDAYGITVLRCGVKNGNPVMVRALLAAGADPNSYVGQGMYGELLGNPFLEAVSSKNPELTAAFLQPATARKITPEVFGQAVATAIDSGQVEILEQILSTNKIDPQLKGRYFTLASPLLHAMSAHQPQMIKLLMEHGVRMLPDGVTEEDLICRVVDREGVEMTRALLDGGLRADGWCRGIPLLSEAVTDGDPAMIELLLERGADIDAAVKTGKFEGWSPLMFAVSNDKPELVTLLAQKGAATDVLVTGFDDHGSWMERRPVAMTPLMKAAEQGHVGMILTLIRAGANIDQPNDKGYTPLMTAARFGRTDAVNTLLMLGADPTLVTKRRYGLLRLATLSNEPGVQRLLLGKTNDSENELELSVAARLGEFEYLNGLLQGSTFRQRTLDRALMATIRANPQNARRRDMTMPGDEGKARLKIIKALIAAGADPNAGTGYSPYAMLIQSQYDAAWKKQVALLLNELGADINHPFSVTRDTPIIEATRSEIPELVALFLELGADPCKPNKAGFTALDSMKKDPENKTRQALLKGGVPKCKE